MAWAQGRDLGLSEEESEGRKVTAMTAKHPCTWLSLFPS